MFYDLKVTYGNLEFYYHEDFYEATYSTYVMNISTRLRTVPTYTLYWSTIVAHIPWISQYFFFLYILKRARFLSLMAVIVIFIYIQFVLTKRFYIQKEKNSILFTNRIKKIKYWVLSWAIKMEFCISEKLNNSIATKLCTNLLNIRGNKIRLFLVHDTIKQLSCVVHYLNVKINWKLAEKMNAQLCSTLKWERV